MKKLSQQELDQKITQFLEGRFSAHPEIEKSVQRTTIEVHTGSVVSRVKSFSKKVFSVPVSTIYQSR